MVSYDGSHTMGDFLSHATLLKHNLVKAFVLSPMMVISFFFFFYQPPKFLEPQHPVPVHAPLTPSWDCSSDRVRSLLKPSPVLLGESFDPPETAEEEGM